MRRGGVTGVVCGAGIGYLLGTFPSAALAARAAGAGDIRTLGSGNPGAANAIGQLGKGWGAAVLVADVAKGAAASAVGRSLGGDLGSHVAGCAAVAGHCYPVWTGFDGGKGVAAGVGQCLVTFPAFVVPDLAVAGLTSAVPWWKERAEAATVVSTLAWVVAAVVWWRRRLPNLWGPRPSGMTVVASATTGAMVLQRFRAGRGRGPLGTSDPGGPS